MNIFALSTIAKEAAEAHGDKHVVKMILEACQMLYSAHWTATYPQLLQERSAIKISRLSKTLTTPEHMMDAPKRKSGDVGYSPVHLHHPCTIWVREISGNYLWTAELAISIAEEYEFRWPGRTHSCKEHAVWLKNNLPPGMKRGERNSFAVAMDPQYKVEDPVQSYINFYRGSKRERNLTTYTRRSPPLFLLEPAAVQAV
jgi:hypothetical protein